jgi:hypothetical protein
MTRLRHRLRLWRSRVLWLILTNREGGNPTVAPARTVERRTPGYARIHKTDASAAR